MACKTCPHCGKLFPNADSLNRHISHSKKCLSEHKEDIARRGFDAWNAPPQTDTSDTVPHEPENSRSPTPTHDLDFNIEINMEALNAEDPPLDASGPSDQDLPSPQHESSSDRPSSRRTTVEDVPDEGDFLNNAHYVHPCPAELQAGATIGQGIPEFERIKERLKKEGSEFGPFADENEWELAEWLLCNVGQMQAEAFLKLPIVSGIYF